MKRPLLSLTLLGLSASGLAMAPPLPQDVQTLGCANCHAMNHKVLGPGWLQIAQRYSATRSDPATLDALVKKVSRGGAGAWGETPMVASDPAGLRQDKIRGVVTWVLNLPEHPPQMAAQK